MKSEEEVTQLNSIQLMLAYLCAEKLPNLNEKVRVLDKFGLCDADIAKVCSTSVPSIHNARSANKKKGK